MKATFILGGNIYKTAKGRWQTSSFSEGDEHGVLGDRLRVIAGEYLFKDDQHQDIVVLGGHGQLEGIEGAPFVSEVMRDELVERGIAADHIVTETESGNTYQQLQHLKRLCAERGYTDMILVTNEYHMPRVQALIGRDADLEQMLERGALTVESAEKILIEHEPKWERTIREAYESDAMRHRIAQESAGVEQIKKGTYRFR